MRVAIDARELSSGQQGGFRSYAESVVCAVGASAGVTVYLDRQPDYFTMSEDLTCEVCGPSQLALREQFSLPRRMERDRVDVAHFVANTAPLRCRVPYVLTLHDTFCMTRSTTNILAHGSVRNKVLSLYAKAIPFLAARRAARIITVSDYSAQAIAGLLKMDRSKIAVVPQSLHPRYRRVDVLEMRRALCEELGVRKLVLVLGSAEPRKNLRRVMESVRLAEQADNEIGVVVTWSARESFHDWAYRVGAVLPERLKLLVGVSDDKLVQMYSAVDFLLFVSTDEGFGLPVVEAMACGCPVITSAASCLPETAGGAALLADPFSTTEISASIVRLAEDDGLRQQLTVAGSKRATKFSLPVLGTRLLEVYSAVASGSDETKR